MNRLDEIEARTNAATEGPWRASVVATYVDADGRRRGKGGIYPGGEPGPPPLFLTMDWLATDAEFIAHARTDVPDMAAALRAVLEIHQDGGESQGYLDDGSYGDMPHCCTECGSLGEYGVPFPCPTVAAIRRYLGDDL